MMKYRKKPVVIDAIQWDGTKRVLDELIALGCPLTPGEMIIPTLEGNMLIKKGDWVIKGVNGEFYPCKPDIFEKTYKYMG